MLESTHQRHEISASKQVLEMLTVNQSGVSPTHKERKTTSTSTRSTPSIGWIPLQLRELRALGYKNDKPLALPRYQVLNWKANFFAREINQWFRA